MSNKVWLEFVWSSRIVNSSFYVLQLIWEIFILNRSKKKILCAGNIKAEFQIAILDFTDLNSDWWTVTNLICVFLSCRKFNKNICWLFGMKISHTVRLQMKLHFLEEGKWALCIFFCKLNMKALVLWNIWKLYCLYNIILYYGFYLAIKVSLCE